MIAVDHITIIAFDKAAKRISAVSVSRPLLPGPRDVKRIAEVVSSQNIKKEFPVEKWTMPPEPHCYIKCKKHDPL